MPRTSAVLLSAAVVLVAACTASPRPVPTETPTTDHFTHPPARPLRCPPTYPSTDRYAVPGNREALVPDTPFATVVCIYAFPVPSGPPHRVVLDSARTRALASLLNAAENVATTEVVSCPAEDSVPIALFFDYADGPVQLVRAATSGCLFASNGHVSVYEPASVVHDLKHLDATQG
jgi:hypothetical protein